jgi:hypothetical protein
MRRVRAQAIAWLVGLTGIARADVFVELGANDWHFPRAPDSVTPRTLASSATESEPRRLVTSDQRLGLGLRYGLYLAFDLELGAFDPEPVTFSGMIATVSPGIRARLGPIELSAELAGGTLVSSSQSTIASEPLLEARGRADVWITRSITLGGTAGTSVIDRGWMAGVAVGYCDKCR